MLAGLRPLALPTIAVDWKSAALGGGAPLRAPSGSPTSPPPRSELIDEAALFEALKVDIYLELFALKLKYNSSAVSHKCGAHGMVPKINHNNL